jgi:two-component system sensor histidine kinase DesK
VVNQDRFDIADRSNGERAGEGGGPGSPLPEKRSRDLPAPRVAHIILVMALLSYTVVTVLNILGQELPAPQQGVALVLLAAILTLQFRHSAPGANRAPLWQRCLTLTVQALLTYLPFLVFRAEWGAMAGFLAGSLLLLLPARVGWSLYAVVGASLSLPASLEGRSVLVVVYLCQSTLLTGLVTYGLSRLSELVKEVHAARDELTHMAVTEERLRFARDLHDLLGFSLSAITLKSELIHRLIPQHPQRAREEVQDVLTVARDSLADVRRVARGFQDMSLEQEISSARSVLNAADIGTKVRVSLGSVSTQSSSVLAAVLREAVTNVLRHSKADNCGIEATQVNGNIRLLVTNDGAEPNHHEHSPHGGSGLMNLETRVRAIGGEVKAGRVDGSQFRLLAVVPDGRE